MCRARRFAPVIALNWSMAACTPAIPSAAFSKINFISRSPPAPSYWLSASYVPSSEIRTGHRVELVDGGLHPGHSISGVLEDQLHQQIPTCAVVLAVGIVCAELGDSHRSSR